MSNISETIKRHANLKVYDFFFDRHWCIVHPEGELDLSDDQVIDILEQVENGLSKQCGFPTVRISNHDIEPQLVSELDGLLTYDDWQERLLGNIESLRQEFIDMAKLGIRLQQAANEPSGLEIRQITLTR